MYATLRFVDCHKDSVDVKLTHNKAKGEIIMSYVTGKTIKELREKRKLTQKELAENINVSDKTISKWETGKGLPDIGIMEELSKALGISIGELLTGEYRKNENRSGNMKNMKFYVCPVCGNVIATVGAGSFSCCGITLPEQEISARFRKKGHGVFYAYCNRHGLFQVKI